MSKHWTPDDGIRTDLQHGRGGQDAPPIRIRMMLLAAAALFGAALAIGEVLLR